jgi:hypothetical protein
VLTLKGILRQALQTGGGRRKDGSVVPVRNLVQVEATDGGRLKLLDLTVADLDPWTALEGREVSIPVRAYAMDGRVHFAVVEGQ